MKQIILLSALLVLLCGCETISPKSTGVPKLCVEKELVELLDQEVLDAFCKVRTVTYKGEAVGVDYWKTPKETSSKMEGDCEDSAFYLQDLLMDLGVDSWVVVGKFIPDSDSWHGWVECNVDGVRIIMDPTAHKIMKHSDREELYDSGKEEATKWDLFYMKQRFALMRARLKKEDNNVGIGIVILGEKMAQ